MDILIVSSIVVLAFGLAFNLVALRVVGRNTARFRRLMLGGALICLIVAPVLFLTAIM